MKHLLSEVTGYLAFGRIPSLHVTLECSSRKFGGKWQYRLLDFVFTFSNHSKLNNALFFTSLESPCPMGEYSLQGLSEPSTAALRVIKTFHGSIFVVRV